MEEEDKVREKFMLDRIKQFDKYSCVVQLGVHHLRSIPITKGFLDFCGDKEDDRGIVKDLTVSFPSPIFEYYKDKSFAIIIREKENYINECKYMDFLKEYNNSKEATNYINKSKSYDPTLKGPLNGLKKTKKANGEIAVADNRIIGYILVEAERI